MPNYDLYVELALDKDMPPAEIGALLEGRINTLLGQGFQQSSPEVDQLSTARAILSDPFKRNTYEAALAGEDGVVDVTWLHALADSAPTSAPISGTPAASSAGFSSPYDATATTTLGGAHASEAPFVNQSLQSPQNPAQSYGEPYGQQMPFGAENVGNQYNAGSFAQMPRTTAARSQFDTAALSVAGRDRSESKAYLACLAIIVLGMVYPLVLLFTADDTSFDLFKGILFAIAHTAVWVSIAEIIWGVRRIVAPAVPTESVASSDATNSMNPASSGQ